LKISYLVRYGIMSRVGPFSAEADAYARGQTVVVRSSRGSELGEILLRTPAGVDAPAPCQVLRPAGADDLQRAHEVREDRPNRLAACERIFRDGIWPLELIDVEPLLEERRTVLHYLGPHHLDIQGLRPIFRDACGLDIVLEPAGLDAADEPVAHDGQDHSQGCGSCGSSGGGCGQGAKSEGHGCSSCAIASLVSSRRGVAAH